MKHNITVLNLHDLCGTQIQLNKRKYLYLLSHMYAWNILIKIEHFYALRLKQDFNILEFYFGP